MRDIATFPRILVKNARRDLVDPGQIDQVIAGCVCRNKRGGQNDAGV